MMGFLSISVYVFKLTPRWSCFLVCESGFEFLAFHRCPCFGCGNKSPGTRK